MASAMATVRRAMSACMISTMRPSSWTTPLPLFSGRSKAAMILRAQTISASDGEKTPVAGVDLAGVNQRLAVEAHVAALLAFVRQAVGVGRGR